MSTTTVKLLAALLALAAGTVACAIAAFLIKSAL
jgi:hypothetical protein